jgi:DNA N-6-adenine-methyltransferase (Dam)
VTISPALYSSRSEEWAPPQAFFNALDAEFHFTLDACASKENTKCSQYIDKGQTYDYKWDEKAAKRDEAKEERIQAKVTELCKAFGCVPVFQGDPRGNVLKIQVPDGYTNDWGREGICVPTS